MAQASKKHFGKGSQGKGSGEGAMPQTAEDTIPENRVLSNRDKAQHTRERGADGKQIQTEQYHDHAANRMDGD